MSKNKTRLRLRSFERLVKPSNILLLISSQIFWWASTAQAGLLGGYTPSSNPIEVEQRRTMSSGSRANCKSNLPESSLTLLVPKANVVHHTSSAAPSLFLHSQVASTLPFRFTLVNPQAVEPVVEQTFSISQPGIKQLELPKSAKLEEGKIYLWYVTIPCQRNTRKYQEVLGAAVKRVPVDAKITRQLQQSSTREETAAVYATHGIWHEALSHAIQQATEGNPTEAGLTVSATSEDSNVSSLADRDRSEYLEQLLLDVGLVFSNKKEETTSISSFR